MPKGRERLTRVRSQMDSISSAMPAFFEKLSACDGLFTSRQRRHAILTDSIAALATEIDRMAGSIREVCDVLQEECDDPSDATSS